MKCPMPNCRSNANPASGLCRYHEEKSGELAVARAGEQMTPEEEERERLKLWHAQTREKFTTPGSGDRARQERDQRQRESEERRRQSQARQRDKISNLEKAIRGIVDSMARDSSQMEDLRRKQSNIKPGRNASEMHRKIGKSMDEVVNRRADKQRKLGEMEDSLARMKRELDSY